MIPNPPVARHDPTPITQHGHTRIDAYAWMRDPDWQRVLRDPAVLRADIREHLVAENAYTDAVLHETRALQDAILAEIRGRMKTDEMSLPRPDGAWAYYSRYAPGAQHPVHARRPRDGGTETVLVDAEALAQGHAYYRLGNARHSPDHRLFAYAEDAQGSEVYRVRVRDLQTGELLADAVENCTGNFVFSPDSAWIFWTFRDDHGRPTRVLRRPARGGADVPVYAEADPGFFLGVEISESRAYVVITCGDKSTSEAWLIPAADPCAPPRLVQAREAGIRYDLTHWNDRFVIRTDADGAVDFKLVVAPETSPGRAFWRDWVPHRPGTYVGSVFATAGHLIRTEREVVENRIVVTPHDGDAFAIDMPEAAHMLHPQPGLEYETDEIRFTYESPTTPRQTWSFDLRSHARALLKTQEVPSGHDASAYVAERLFARAADGAEIPVTLLRRRDVAADGSAPLFLYGYGAYGHAIEPGFSIRALSLVDRGWVWAIAHVRGGSERGWAWFLAGRGASKPNSFTDFVAAAEALIAAGYGRAGEVVAHGASAGGMLMGAVANLRPDLFAGIVAGVPFVDVLNTMSDPTLPLTPPEWPEWGNPIDSAADYEAIARYSPYDQVAPRAYPCVLATGGLSDPRVTYWEPAKWVARLRDATTSQHPILLRMNMDAGHGGAAGRFDALREVATTYAFAIWAHTRATLG